VKIAFRRRRCGGPRCIQAQGQQPIMSKGTGALRRTSAFRCRASVGCVRIVSQHGRVSQGVRSPYAHCFPGEGSASWASEVYSRRGRRGQDRLGMARPHGGKEMRGPLLAKHPQPSHATPMVCSVSQGVRGHALWCAPSVADQTRVHRAALRFRDPGPRVGRSVSCAEVQRCPIHKIRQQRLLGMI
jgi:hypothetical protein